MLPQITALADAGGADFNCYDWLAIDALIALSEVTPRKEGLG